MKVLPKIKTLSIEKEDSNNLKVNINESAVVRYKLSDNYEDKLDIAQDLVENRAFGTLFLFLNENFKVITNIPSLIPPESIENFYEDCDRLLNENINIVEELGKPLTEIDGYPIFESERGVLRGSGKKKIKEYFKEFEEIDLKDLTLDFVKNHKYETIIKGMCMCPKCGLVFDKEENTIEVQESGVEPYSTFDSPYNERIVTYDVEYVECPNCHTRESEEDFPDALVSDLPDASNAEELVPGISKLDEDADGTAEGTQTSDIAGKTDYDFNITTPTNLEKKKKHYDILLGNYNRNEIDESVSFKGFLKNSKGQYQRGNYVLVKEGDKYLAVHKDKLDEYQVQGNNIILDRNEFTTGAEVQDMAKTIQETLQASNLNDNFTIKTGVIDGAVGIAVTRNSKDIDLVQVQDNLIKSLQKAGLDNTDYESDIKNDSVVFAIINPLKAIKINDNK